MELTADRRLPEIFDTAIGTLQSTVMLLLAFFIFALIAVVIVRIFETRAARTEAQHWPEQGPV